MKNFQKFEFLHFSILLVLLVLLVLLAQFRHSLRWTAFKITEEFLNKYKRFYVNVDRKYIITYCVKNQKRQRKRQRFTFSLNQSIRKSFHKIKIGPPVSSALLLSFVTQSKNNWLTIAEWPICQVFTNYSKYFLRDLILTCRRQRFWFRLKLEYRIYRRVKWILLLGKRYHKENIYIYPIS